mmetsp:Transcript_91293/g.244466  ORF Transcript_91293/g.244466 Transcript_91293/m.244466 type:complete len:217 (+) Transcript_91293:307-957(+)
MRFAECGGTAVTGAKGEHKMTARTSGRQSSHGRLLLIVLLRHFARHCHLLVDFRLHLLHCGDRSSGHLFGVFGQGLHIGLLNRPIDQVGEKRGDGNICRGSTGSHKCQHCREETQGSEERHADHPQDRLGKLLKKNDSGEQQEERGPDGSEGSRYNAHSHAAEHKGDALLPGLLVTLTVRVRQMHTIVHSQSDDHHKHHRLQNPELPPEEVGEGDR